MSQSFLGRGWSFPPSFNQALAGVEMLEQEADIASSLQVLLTTTPGERMLLPEFGCNLNELLFENLDTTTRTLLEDKIESAILYFEPRITIENVRLDGSNELEGTVLINLTYRVRTTNSRFNFVFPFYKQEGTDINLLTTLNLLPDND